MKILEILAEEKNEVFLKKNVNYITTSFNILKTHRLDNRKTMAY